MAAIAWSVLAGLAAPALAQGAKTYCSEPVTPFCTGRGGVFEDDQSRERCRADVEKYVDGMREFVACLDVQQEEAQTRARAIEARFQCMAEGRDDCR